MFSSFHHVCNPVVDQVMNWLDAASLHTGKTRRTATNVLLFISDQIIFVFSAVKINLLNALNKSMKIIQVKYWTHLQNVFSTISPSIQLLLSFFFTKDRSASISRSWCGNTVPSLKDHKFVKIKDHLDFILLVLESHLLFWNMDMTVDHCRQFSLLLTSCFIYTKPQTYGAALG